MYFSLPNIGSDIKSRSSVTCASCGRRREDATFVPFKSQYHSENCYRWKRNIKMGIRETGSGGLTWIRLTRDKIQ
jgi:hypothetical protein